MGKATSELFAPRMSSSYKDDIPNDMIFLEVHYKVMLKHSLLEVNFHRLVQLGEVFNYDIISLRSAQHCIMKSVLARKTDKPKFTNEI